MSNLADRLVGGSTRWHRRSILRRWPDDPGDPWTSDSGFTTGGHDDGMRAAFRIQRIDTDDHAILSVRGVIVADDEKFLAELDFDARFHIPVDLPPTEEEIDEFIDDYGLVNVWGHLVAGLTDAVRSVGLAAPVIPPSQFDHVKATLTRPAS